MTNRQTPALLCVLLLASVTGCSPGSCRSKSFAELLGMGIFRESVAEIWQIDGTPTSAFAPRGYIHAVYDQRDGFCSCKVWVIDKCSRKNAEGWLNKLLRGEHTETSIEPFPPGYAENQAYYAGFSRAPVSVGDRPLYERSASLQGGYVQYAVYFTSGPFVVGAENTLCPIQSAEDGREAILPILEALSLQD